MSSTTTPQVHRQSSSSSSGGGDQREERLVRIGVAAMDRKSRSKPMRNILSKLLATGKYETIIFGDKVILDESVENWPLCEFLISFFSANFPMNKAIEYVKLRKPICINDVPMQKIFWDRRSVLDILAAIKAPTPRRIVVNRDTGPNLDKDICDTVEKELGIRIDKPRKLSDFEYFPEEERIQVDGTSLFKPFVEKPVSGEDHNINIYFSKAQGGGGRRLFRKVGNKSSEYDPKVTTPRTDGSYVYEQLVEVENSEDIKIYTLGPSLVHAESRKSPVVDGVVRRNDDGKEIRYITQLTEEELKIARNISLTFKQSICGFDLLRVEGKPFVIDVNGWSFVKGNDEYYDRCATMLHDFCMSHLPNVPRNLGRDRSTSPREKSWHLKSVISVLRHADRTPKSKMKFTFGRDDWARPFHDLLQNRREEILLRQPQQLGFIAEAADRALQREGANTEVLHQLKYIIEKKIDEPGAKAQLKPAFDKKGNFQKIQVIIKWGGLFTHAAAYQSRDLGENFRKDLYIMNKSIFDATTIYSSSEPRVIATAEVFSTVFLEDQRPSSGSHSKETSTNGNGTTSGNGNGEGEKIRPKRTHQLIIRKDLLDDSNAAKEPMDKVKKRLKTLLRPSEYERPEFGWSVPDKTPSEVVRETCDIMRHLRGAMNMNWKTLDVEKVQSRWCCGELPFLFRERWEKLFQDFCDIEPEKFDPSRVSELYDNLKFDTLHNRVFLETIFADPGTEVILDKPGTNTERRQVPKLKELYQNAKVLFDFISPQEYGIEKEEKKKIGLLTSLPLLMNVLEDLRAAANSNDDRASASFYITKESHIHTFVNLVTLSDLPMVMPRVPELDFLSYLTFEVFHRWNGSNRETSVRLALSPGAHSHLPDSSLDSKHCIQAQPRQVLTNHLDLETAITTLSQYLAMSRFMKKSTTPLEGLISIPIEAEELFGGGSPPTGIEIREFSPAQFVPSAPGSDTSS